MKGKCKVLCMLIIAMLTFSMTAESAVFPAYAKTSEKKATKKSKKKNKKAKSTKKTKAAKKSKKAKESKSADTTAASGSNVGTAAVPQTVAAPVPAAPVQPAAPATPATPSTAVAEAPQPAPQVAPEVPTPEQQPAVTAPMAPKTEQQPAVTEPAAPKTEQQPAVTAPTVVETEAQPAPEQPKECQHEWGWAIVKEPTCKGVGYRIQQCAACGETKGGQKIIDPLGHVFHTTEEPGTCQKAGKITEVCERCGETYTKSTGYGSHVYASAFPCADEKCTVCGHTRVKTGMQGHDFCGEERVVTAATCTTPGTKNVFCRYGCGASVTKEIPATGHSYSGWVRTQNSTCSTEGVEKATCTVCHAEQTRTLACTGHTWATEVTKQPTCKDTGIKRTYCTVCGVSSEEAIPTTEHKLGRRCAFDGCHAEGEGCEDVHCHAYVDTCVYCGARFNIEDGTWS